MKKKVRILAILLVVVVMTALSLNGCASLQRELKSIGSDLSGGLNRTVTVYDYNGQPIKSWSGKFDLSESENEIFFDNADGKRVIIHGGIIICEEN